MTSAEFKTYREALGLTIQHIADITKSSLRTVKYWESGESKVPSKAVVAVKGIDESVNRAVDNMVKIVEESIANSTREAKITLLRYQSDEDLWRYVPHMSPFSVATHAVMLFRAQQAIAQKGADVRIVYMDTDHYNKWLSGRQDTAEMRAVWADSLP